MEILYRLVSGFVAALAALVCPIVPLILSAVAFIFVDFLTGGAASYVEARRSGREWWFESRKAWRTILKTVFVVVGIVMSWVLDSCVLEFMHLNLARLFTGFVCGVELWSFLENGATISHSPLLAWLGRIVKRRVDEEVQGE